MDSKREYFRNYMREYNKADATLNCDVCNGKYRKQSFKKHERTNKHILGCNKEILIQTQINKLTEELNNIRTKKNNIVA